MSCNAKKDPNGTWRIQYRWTDWTGTKKKSQKRGFKTKKEAEEWYAHFMLQQSSDPTMTLIIDEYNNEQDRAIIEKTFMDLMNLANSMNQEEKRYVREGFTSDEELSLYDMLFNENLSKEDINKIKKVAVDLLEKIKAKISELDHWTEKQETRDDIETYIGAILWEELPESYSDNEIFAYRQKIYEYVFMRYKEVA